MEDSSEEKGFSIEKAKSGRAACKKCKQKCNAGELRIAKHVQNYFSDSATMKNWYHIDCLFDAFKKQKSTTKKIESVEDIEGWDNITEEERDQILEKLHACNPLIASPSPNKKTKTNVAQFKLENKPAELFSKNTKKDKILSTTYETSYRLDSDDNLFKTFRDICEKIANQSGYIMKSETLQQFIIKGTNKKIFEGDIYLWFKLLLPMTIRRIYNLQSKQIVKLFSRVFRTNSKEMLIDLEQGDVSETVRKYYENSNNIKPKKLNKLTMQEVDKFLDTLSQLTKEDEQIDAFLEFCNNCNADDLKMVIRLIKHDLKINAGPRHILDALNPNAYSTFQLSRDLKMVVEKFASTITLNKISLKDTKNKEKSSKTGVQIMSPISPMLASACKSVETAINKNPEGMFSEIKYDGERVQIHKSGNEFRFFTRNLKPVLDHKIARCKEFIPKAFPSGHDLILDSEILVVNTQTGALMPFGTLGVHKREEFLNSEVCLFIFDCVYFNGEDLTNRTLTERKKILEENIKPIKHHVQLSEFYLINTKKELATMTAKVLKAGLEGLVLKNVNSLYEPGKRGWLKIKKDYLFEGQMADTADLVVLGGWFGTGRKGGMLSVFLMGTFDENNEIWKTVTKVSSGIDDTQMDNLQNDLKPLMERSNSKSLPKWLECKRQLIPDFICINPINMPVWEITGAEFSKSEVHTANGISIRFPRITRFRNDKSAKEATNLEELEMLYASSKESINVDMLFKNLKDDESENISIKTKLFDAEIKIEKQNDEENIDESFKESDKSSKRKIVKSESSEQNKKVKVNKKNKSETSIKEVEKVEKQIEIFENLIIFLMPHGDDDKHEKLSKTIIKNGGTIINESQNADYVIHFVDKNLESDEVLRKKYSPNCKHLTHKWLEDCIKDKKFVKKYQDYAVKL